MSDNPFSLDDSFDDVPVTTSTDVGNPFTDGVVSAGSGQEFRVVEEIQPAPRPPPPAATSPSFFASAKSGLFPIRSGANLTPTELSTIPSSNGASGSQTAARRERELDEREKALEAREGDLKKLIEDSGYRPKNWPKFYPILYHNIEEEIPMENQRLCRTCYYSWILTFVGYLFFWFACLIGVIMDSDKLLDGFANFVVNTLAVVIGVWASWNVWYRSLYKATKTDSVMAYAWFFLHHTIHIGWWVWSAVGLTALNYPPGCITMLEAFSSVNVFTGVVYAFAFGFDCAVAALSCWVQLYAIKKFRGQGGVEELRSQTETAGTVGRAMGWFGGGATSTAATTGYTTGSGAGG